VVVDREMRWEGVERKEVVDEFVVIEVASCVVKVGGGGWRSDERGSQGDGMRGGQLAYVRAVNQSFSPVTTVVTWNIDTSSP
jgi:hypothetical protein